MDETIGLQLNIFCVGLLALLLAGATATVVAVWFVAASMLSSRISRAEEAWECEEIS